MPVPASCYSLLVRSALAVLADVWSTSLLALSALLALGFLWSLHPVLAVVLGTPILAYHGAYGTDPDSDASLPTPPRDS